MRQLESTLSLKSLTAYLLKQVDMFYPDGVAIDLVELEHIVSIALTRMRVCFDPISIKYFTKNDRSVFNHLNGDQYSMFLYLASNTAFKNGQENMATKLFLLNKAMFAIDAFYKIELPEHFLFVHPLGTVLGNASYHDFFVAYQGVTVGSTNDGKYPSFSTATVLYSNTSVLGDCHTGKNFIMAANATIINKTIGDNKVCVGNYPNNRIIDNENNMIRNYFSI